MKENMIVANLLNNPKQVQFLNVSGEWFEARSLGLIVDAIVELNGEVQTSAEITEQIKEKTGERITIEELESLKAINGQEKYSFSATIPFLHKEFLRKKLNLYMAKYQVEGRKKYLKVVSELTEEMDAINTNFDDGLLATSLEDFKAELYKTESTSIQTYPNIGKMIGGGFRPGQLITIGARSGVGKTLVSINFMMDAQERNKGIRTDFFSLEMSKFEIVDRILSKKAGINSLKLVDYTNLTKEDKAKVLQEYKDLANNYDIGLFGEQFQTLGVIKRKIKERAIAGKYMAFIDYAGLINVEGVNNGGDSSGRIKMNIITRELKLLASELKIPIFLLAQLNRGLEYRQDKTPGLQDLKESGSLEQDSSMVFFISKDEEDKNLAYLDIAKNRVGMKGRLEFYMNPSFMEFRQFDEQ